MSAECADSDGVVIHGDPGHSCYDAHGIVVCVIGKLILNDGGPTWRDFMKEQ